MANITLSGDLLDPAGFIAIGDTIRFTHKSNTGKVVKSSLSQITIPTSGSYLIDLQYGLVKVDYKDVLSNTYTNLGVVTVNQDTTATTLPELLNAVVPPTDAQLLEFQAILADCVTESSNAAQSATEAATSATDAAASAATIDLINDLSQAYEFTDINAMTTSATVFLLGKRLKTGQGVWVVNSTNGLDIAGGLKAAPLNGVFMNDCGAKGDSLYRDNSTGLWYVDVGLTVASSDDTAAFILAMASTGGTDSKGTINFGEGGYYIAPESIDADGIDIRQKTLKGLGYETSNIVQSGNNTYQTFFRNNPRNLSEAGAWGSGGKYRIHDIAIRGNWDGASGQTATVPPSGNGNGLIGIAKVDYDFDTQGGVLQLISSTRFEFINIKVSRGYGHNIKLYRGGYSSISTGFVNETRGSGIWIAGDGYTSSPIEKIKFETCRGGYGGIFGNGISGSAINDNLFEGQPYGIYMEIANDLIVTGNYMEAHYSEDFYINSGCWGITDVGNYEFAQQDPRDKLYKGYFGYRRDSGLHVNTDNITYGTRPADVNKFYMQRDSIGHGAQPAPLTGQGGVYQNMHKQLSGGGTSLGWSTSIRQSHNSTDDSGAAEIRFKRNLSFNTWSAIAFATYNGATLTDKFEIRRDGDVEVLTEAKGIILKSLNGTRYRVLVDNSGNVITQAV